MKKLILLAVVMLVASLTAGAQTTKVSDDNVKRDGKTFVQTSSRGATESKDIATDYTWRDSKGNEYPIFLHQRTRGDKAGTWTAYVWRKSKNTNKDYKSYLKDGDSIAEQIRKEMNL